MRQCPESYSSRVIRKPKWLVLAHDVGWMVPPAVLLVATWYLMLVVAGSSWLAFFAVFARVIIAVGFACMA